MADTTDLSQATTRRITTATTRTPRSPSILKEMDSTTEDLILQDLTRIHREDSMATHTSSRSHSTTGATEAHPTTSRVAIPSLPVGVAPPIKVTKVLNPDRTPHRVTKNFKVEILTPTRSSTRAGSRTREGSKVATSPRDHRYHPLCPRRAKESW